MPLESFLKPIDEFESPDWEVEKMRFLDILEEVETSMTGTAPFARFMKSKVCRIGDHRQVYNWQFPGTVSESTYAPFIW